MNFSKSVIEIIQGRTSRRTYSGQPLEKEMREKVTNLLENHDLKSPFSKYTGKTRFKLISIPEFDPNERKKLGTYGLIKGAQDFIVGAVEKSKFNREHFGYLMETLILAATDIGLGTCWLGGFFNKTLFAAKIESTADEIVPAITPIGYSIQRSFREKVIRSYVKAKKRLPWNKLFFEGDPTNPIKEENLGKYSLLLEMVRIGPSAANRQPWRIIKDLNKKVFHFYTIKAKSSISSNYDKFPPLDIGIAVCHFDLTAKELELEGKWVFEEPKILGAEDLLYKITWNGEY